MRNVIFAYGALHGSRQGRLARSDGTESDKAVLLFLVGLPGG
jgi:hypothetical protein